MDICFEDQVNIFSVLSSRVGDVSNEMWDLFRLFYSDVGKGKSGK